LLFPVYISKLSPFIDANSLSTAFHLRALLEHRNFTSGYR
jgi:hypothetical protein